MWSRSTIRDSVAAAAAAAQLLVQRQLAGAIQQQRYAHRQQRQGVLVAIVGDEETVDPVHAEHGHQRDHRQHQRRRAHQQAEQQRQAAKELATAGQQRHQVAGGQADRFHPLAHAGQAVAAEPAEQLLRAVGHEGQADHHAQYDEAVTTAGGQQGNTERIHDRTLFGPIVKRI